MVWCSHCGKDQPTERDDVNGFVCCTGCGRVHEDTIFSCDPTFQKSAGGQSQLAGNFVRDGQYCSYGRFAGELSHEYGFKTDSHLKTLEKGKDEIEIIAETLCIGGREDVVNFGHRLYKIAVERNFTRGRRRKQVAAACLYIACRQYDKPVLLIDFSDVLQVNVYVLGAVFLQLCKLLRLEQHPLIQKPVDPSLFIHRFTDRLVGRATSRDKFFTIANTALRILASMKRDWMQTGRKPSGVCGAALYISALSHGIGCTKVDIVNIVHICEATLTKRLIEFENTESGSLTAEEFEDKAKELEAEMKSMKVRPINQETKGIKCITELLCVHKEEMGVEHFAHGLCHECYKEFVKISGGIQGGSAPPAFQHAEEQRRKESLVTIQGKEVLEEDRDEGSPHLKETLESNVRNTKEKVKIATDKLIEDGDVGFHDKDKDKRLSYEDVKNPYKSTPLPDGDGEIRNNDNQSGILGSCITEVAIGCQSETDDWIQSQPGDKVQDDMDEKLETLSDIDDEEVEKYLHNEEEVRLKTMIWTEMNKEYLEEQAAKEEAIAAAEEAHAAALAAAAEGAPGAVELAEAAAAAVAKLKKEKQRKRTEAAKNKVPPKSAAEATRQMLVKKKLSSKVNYDVLEKLFEDNKKNDMQISNATNDKKDNSLFEKGKRTRAVSWADDDYSDFKCLKRQDLQGDFDQGQLAELKDEGMDPNMEDEADGGDLDLADQDAVDNERFQPYKLQYEHEEEYQSDYEEY